MTIETSATQHRDQPRDDRAEHEHEHDQRDRQAELELALLEVLLRELGEVVVGGELARDRRLEAVGRARVDRMDHPLDALRLRRPSCRPAGSSRACSARRDAARPSSRTCARAARPRSARSTVRAPRPSPGRRGRRRGAGGSARRRARSRSRCSAGSARRGGRSRDTTPGCSSSSRPSSACRRAARRSRRR